MRNAPEYIHSELPANTLFQEMGYHYFNGEQHQERSNLTEEILKDRLLASIKRINPWINDNYLNIRKINK